MDAVDMDQGLPADVILDRALDDMEAMLGRERARAIMLDRSEKIRRDAERSAMRGQLWLVGLPNVLKREVQS